MLNNLHNITCPTLPFPVLSLCPALFNQAPCVVLALSPVLLSPLPFVHAPCRAICMAYPHPPLPLSFGARSWVFPSVLAPPSFRLS